MTQTFVMCDYYVSSEYNWREMVYNFRYRKVNVSYLHPRACGEVVRGECDIEFHFNMDPTTVLSEIFDEFRPTFSNSLKTKTLIAIEMNSQFCNNWSVEGHNFKFIETPRFLAVSGDGVKVLLPDSFLRTVEQDFCLLKRSMERDADLILSLEQ